MFLRLVIISLLLLNQHQAQEVLALDQSPASEDQPFGESRKFLIIIKIWSWILEIVYCNVSFFISSTARLELRWKCDMETGSDHLFLLLFRMSFSPPSLIFIESFTLFHTCFSRVLSGDSEVVTTTTTLLYQQQQQEQRVANSEQKGSSLLQVNFQSIASFDSCLIHSLSLSLSPWCQSTKIVDEGRRENYIPSLSLPNLESLGWWKKQMMMSLPSSSFPFIFFLRSLDKRNHREEQSCRFFFSWRKKDFREFFSLEQRWKWTRMKNLSVSPAVCHCLLLVHFYFL